ncbi:MAG: hypothetical protein K0M40_06460 [Prolixibacteraceae bacterium]|nr:hypothetical protein [Prolixibacteraceae bacterium]
MLSLLTPQFRPFKVIFNKESQKYYNILVMSSEGINLLADEIEVSVGELSLSAKQYKKGRETQPFCIVSVFFEY